jgi:signal peptidase II
MSSTNSEPSRASRLARLAIVGVVFVIVLALDLWTKAWAWEHLKNGPAVELIEHVFYLKFGFNTGSAFSFLRDASWARYFFIIVTFLALGYMGWLALKMPTERRYGFLAVGLIAAGAAGNLHDRLFRTMDVWMDGMIVERHGVIDFLQFFYNWDEQKYWPIFNVADSALVCGVILLLIFLHYHGAEGELGAPVGKPGEPEGKPGDQYKPIVKSDD